MASTLYVPLIGILQIGPGLERIENCHPRCDSILYLLVDETSLVVHYLMTQLDPTIYRTRVHHIYSLTPNPIKTFTRDPIDPVVFLYSRKILGVLPLHLNPEKVDCIRFPTQSLIKVGKPPYPLRA